MTNLDKLKELLAELFMLDQADLDFGIYRVMNAKRAEVTRFLDHDLLPQVRAALATVDTGDRAALESEKAKAKKYFDMMPDGVFSVGRAGSYLYNVDIDDTLRHAMEVRDRLKS